LQTLEGKLYREIAIEAGYDFDYIKEVGSELWQLISDTVEERVTKKNVRLILSKRYSAAEPSQPNIESFFPVSQELDRLTFSSDCVPINSSLYIKRPPYEERAFAEISRPGSLMRIKAPRQMGKSSLVLRVLEHARQIGFRTITVNLQQADSRIFYDTSKFLQWFCVYITRQLGLKPRMADYWDEDIGSKVSCTLYFQEYLLEQLDSPLVLALDEVNRIFEYPELAQEFLPLLRTWHESAETQIWQKLRLIIVHSTEVYVPLKLSQSPFNVGRMIQLPEFTRSQVLDLAQRYELDQLEIDGSALESLFALVGGHPYLVNLAFHHLRQQDLTLSQLVKEAPTQAGIYSNHLRQHWGVLQENPDLLHAYRQIVLSSDTVQLEAITAYRLESMGLVKLIGNGAIPSCELYRAYFHAQLSRESLEVN
jgi:hypothetical protein